MTLSKVLFSKESSRPNSPRIDVPAHSARQLGESTEVKQNIFLGKEAFSINDLCSVNTCNFGKVEL